MQMSNNTKVKLHPWAQYGLFIALGCCSAALLLAVCQMGNISHWWAWINDSCPGQLISFSFPFLCQQVILYTVRAKSLKTCQENMLRAEWTKGCVLQPAASQSWIHQSCTSVRAPRAPSLSPSPGSPDSCPVACWGKPANNPTAAEEPS